MSKIRLRPNVSYDWLGQTREGGETYEMDDGEADYAGVSGFIFDPDEELATVPESGRFASQIATSRAAIEEKPVQE
jgi:hypothetical protein